MQLVLFLSLGFVICSALLGMYLSKGVHTIKGFTVASRSLPVYVSTATLFATWFGAGSILGIPEAFMEHGLAGAMSDPIGAFLCFMIIGVVFAKRYYQLNITTICDLYYNRFGKKAEIILGLTISCSYLGWIAAQLTAFGMMLNYMLDQRLGIDYGIFIAGLIVVIYTFKGGMLSVAINDFMQACIICISLLFISIKVSIMAGGFYSILYFATHVNIADFRYTEVYPNFGVAIGFVICTILGTIPQQDAFQRITSARSAYEAKISTLLGGILYLVITLMPIFIVIGAAKLEVEATGTLPEEFNLYIAQFIIANTPMFIQVLFFGAFFSAILSTASGTILASSVILASNVIGAFFPAERNLNVMRLALGFVTLVVILIAIYSESPIHSLIENSGTIAMVVAFCPLMGALYWERASHKGIIISTITSMSVWIGCNHYQKIHNIYFVLPPEIFGLITSGISVIVFSLLLPDHPSFRRALALRQRHLGS